MTGGVIAQGGGGIQDKIQSRAYARKEWTILFFQKKWGIMKILLAKRGDIVYKYSTHFFFL